MIKTTPLVECATFYKNLKSHLLFKYEMLISDHELDVNAQVFWAFKPNSSWDASNPTKIDKAAAPGSMLLSNPE